jgi:periplasmic divalent cation tolerance protein
MSELVILSTAETIAIAHNIARTLVESGEAACVNIVPGIQSIYSWQGTVFEEGELMLLIQATSDKFESIRSTIRRLSTCNLPQIIALPITAGDMDYLRWLGGVPIFP